MHLCRLCLNKSEFCFSLFTGNILDKIESLTSIKITKEDNFPKTCCESCMANVYSAYKFQQSIIEANKTLHTLTSDDLATLDDNLMTKGLVLKQEIYMKEETLNSFDDYNEELCDISKDSSSSTLEISDIIMLDDKCIESDTVNRDDNCELISRVKGGTECKLECLECSSKFTTKRLLQLHMAKHRVDGCPFCGVVMRRDNLKKHIQIHTEAHEVCEICGKLAKNKESLRGHMNYAHKKKAKIKCEHCDKEFKSNNHCNTHIRNVHLGIRNHQCHICGKKFFANHDLNKHINMTHKKARPYICSYCKKGFSSPYARKTHIRQHTFETPYRCDICTAGFRQKVSLVTHIKNKHQVTTEDEPVALD